MRPTVYLVGAGPGDPGLITVKAKKLIKTADAIVYDYLSNPIFINECEQTCKLINAGKRLGFKAMTQAQINNKLVSIAKSGFKIFFSRGRTNSVNQFRRFKLHANPLISLIEAHTCSLRKPCMTK